MGLDLTGRNGTEGRISAWAQEAFEKAVQHYYPHIERCWYYGDAHDILTQDDCNKIADALEHAVSDEFFAGMTMSDSVFDAIRALQREEAISQFAKLSPGRDEDLHHRLDAQALKLAEFLRNCGGGFQSV